MHTPRFLKAKDCRAVSAIVRRCDRTGAGGPQRLAGYSKENESRLHGLLFEALWVLTAQTDLGIMTARRELNQDEKECTT